MTRRLLAIVGTMLAAFMIGVTTVGAPVTAQVVPVPPPPPGQQPPPDEPPQEQPPPEQPPAEEQPPPEYPPLPADSGTGRRIVYDVSDQRVWLVEADERVSGSWLVSGRARTPRAGTYSVYSRSRHTTGNNGKVRMEFMLRFVKTKGLPIGFHSIPVDRRGRPVQSEDELGKPRSKGCIRQRWADAERLWNWAPNGTVVRVTA